MTVWREMGDTWSGPPIPEGEKMDKTEFYKHVAEDPDVTIQVANIVVTDDAAAVEVNLWLNHHELFTAREVSRRDPHDRNDPEIGIKLALGRAIRQLGRNILAEGQAKVRQTDKVSRRQRQATQDHKAKGIPDPLVWQGK